jgi:hypothetical protein
MHVVPEQGEVPPGPLQFRSYLPLSAGRCQGLTCCLSETRLSERMDLFGEVLSASENSKTGHVLIVVGVAANSHAEFLLLIMCLNCSSSCHPLVFEN